LSRTCQWEASQAAKEEEEIREKMARVSEPMVDYLSGEEEGDESKQGLLGLTAADIPEVSHAPCL
jgi:hypothetical protein